MQRHEKIGKRPLKWDALGHLLTKQTPKLLRGLRQQNAAGSLDYKGDLVQQAKSPSPINTKALYDDIKAELAKPRDL